MSMRVFSRAARLAGMAAACVALAAPGAAAQRSLDTTAHPGQGRACFQPAPMPVCKSFFITEFGVQDYVSEPPGIHNQRRVLATWELGYMENRSAHEAVGGSLFVSTNDQASRMGVRGRYRRWVGGGAAVDVSPALILFQSDENLEGSLTPGAALAAGVSLSDYLGLNTQVEATQGGVRFQAGVRLGRFPGIATGVGLPLLAFYEAMHDPS
jgi:hypothetical protein